VRDESKARHQKEQTARGGKEGKRGREKKSPFLFPMATRERGEKKSITNFASSLSKKKKGKEEAPKASRESPSQKGIPRVPRGKGEGEGGSREVEMREGGTGGEKKKEAPPSL